MKPKEILFGTFCGCVGAVLAIIAGLFSPIRAQNLDTIICSAVLLSDEEGKIKGQLRSTGLILDGQDGTPLVKIKTHALGGSISVSNPHRIDEGSAGAFMMANEHGAKIALYRMDFGTASMDTDEHGGYIHVTGSADGEVFLE